MRALSALLPQVNAHVTQVEEQLNLATIGFSLKISGVSISSISGPFHSHRCPRIGELECL